VENHYVRWFLDSRPVNRLYWLTKKRVLAPLSRGKAELSVFPKPQKRRDTSTIGGCFQSVLFTGLMKKETLMEMTN